MLHFEHSSLINAPLDVVWGFYERPDVLHKLTPPWQPVKVVRREGGLGIGAESEFLIFLGPLPVRWLARHTAYDYRRLFIDEQVEGPLTSWIHRHEFREEDGKTCLTDAISFSLPGGWVAESLIGWFVLERLHDMFHYRHTITKQECEGQASRV